MSTSISARVTSLLVAFVLLASTTQWAAAQDNSPDVSPASTEAAQAQEEGTISPESRAEDGDSPERVGDLPVSAADVAAFSVGQWTVQNRLGIGTQTPLFEVDVSRNLNGLTRLQLMNPNGGSAGQVDIYMNTGSNNGFAFQKFGPGFSAVRHGIALAGWTRLRTDTGAKGLLMLTGGPQPLILGTNDRQRMVITSAGNVGIGTTAPTSSLHVNGTTTTKVLKITGGSDLAEPFDINSREAVEPGMVVAIDPENPGKLRIADKAYDPTVAGIVSGAGGINPGLILQQEESLMVGEHPVALTGRVYVLADASNGEIQPGDLLTTSDTPGHAMKATDRELAFGATIGKAMSTLDQATGLVLVLVSLQ